jgi:hypothetical protein
MKVLRNRGYYLEDMIKFNSNSVQYDTFDAFMYPDHLAYPDSVM